MSHNKSNTADMTTAVMLFFYTFHFVQGFHLNWSAFRAR